MRVARSILFLTVFLPAAAARSDQSSSYGTEPVDRFSARDIFAEYNLPRLDDQPGDALWASEKTTQVLTRAHDLGADMKGAHSAWTQAGPTFQKSTDDVWPAFPEVTFAGSTASELNQLLTGGEQRVIRVVASVISLDVPIRILQSNIAIDFGTTRLIATKPQTFMLTLEEVGNVHIKGGNFSGAGWGILISRSHSIVLGGTTIQNARGGVMVTNSRAVTIRGGTFCRLEEAPIMLHGDTHQVVVRHNTISGNLGSSNWHAGVVISDRNAHVDQDPDSLLQSDRYGVREQKITSRLTIPSENVIAYNTITGNLSSGIYSDGGAKNAYVQNLIEGNSKEGVCLDNGSAANLVIFNDIRANGKRWGKTDSDLGREFVLKFGRLPDGTSTAKLPGVSIDNAAYNLILFNEIQDNFGGGLKMVRSAFYNVLGMNIINENNEGNSPTFHFFGIEFGAATADIPVPDLDFHASRGNEVFGNSIRGKHYAGIFFAAGSDSNMLFDNSIFGASNWALESVAKEDNLSFNNLSNLPCRNISTGLDPSLLQTGVAQ
jgi:hypothetical protein